MRKPLCALLSLASLLAISGSALADRPAEDDRARDKPRSSCAFVSQINNFKEVDDRTVIIETSPNRRYRVTFFDRCREMRWAIFARVESRPGVCLSKGDVLVFGRGDISERCMIESVEALPPRKREND
jgi:Family of unknown function (DUF6491)